MSETVAKPENENPSSKSILNVIKNHSKFIVSTIAIGFFSYIVNYYISNYQITEQIFGVVVTFSDDVDQNWIKELQNYIVNEIDTPTNKWRAYTNNIARCRTSCNEASNNVSIFFDTKCQTQPVYILDREVTQELLSNMTYAEATLPCFLKLAESKIPDAHTGVFTTKYKIPKGFIFSPYEGVKVNINPDELDKSDFQYTWTIRRPGKVNAEFYIDGKNENNSNWLRYVNCARYREEQNMFPLLFNESVYYMTINDIEPETELLVWYGFKYARWLNILPTYDSKHDRRNNFAPPVTDVICPSCPIKEGKVRDSDLSDCQQV